MPIIYIFCVHIPKLRILVVMIMMQECPFTKCDFCSLMKIEMCKTGNSKIGEEEAEETL